MLGLWRKLLQGQEGLGSPGEVGLLPDLPEGLWIHPTQNHIDSAARIPVSCVCPTKHVELRLNTGWGSGVKAGVKTARTESWFIMFLTKMPLSSAVNKVAAESRASDQMRISEKQQDGV